MSVRRLHFRLGLLDPVHLGLIHNLDFQIVQLGINLVEILRSGRAVQQRVINVIAGQMPLFLGDDQQLANFCRQVQTRGALDHATARRGFTRFRVQGNSLSI